MWDWVRVREQLIGAPFPGLRVDDIPCVVEPAVAHTDDVARRAHVGPGDSFAGVSAIWQVISSIGGSPMVPEAVTRLRIRVGADGSEQTSQLSYIVQTFKVQNKVIDLLAAIDI